MPADVTSRLILATTLAWSQILQLGPYVLGGILVATVLQPLDLPRRWGNGLKRSGPGAVLGAACLGGASPLCTYGTVPVLVAFLRGGASPGPVLAFLVASSLLNPQLFLIMAGGLGLPLALAQVGGVLLLSLPVGLAARRLEPRAFLRPDALTSTPDRTAGAEPAPEGPSTGSTRLQAILHMTESVGLTFVTGVILAALVQTLVPATWTASLLGPHRWYGVLLAGVLGVPLYACGGGAVPVIAGLLAQGMSPGAALAFFLAGPATRLTALASLGTLLNRRALLIYTAYVVAGSALVGTACNLLLGGR